MAKMYKSDFGVAGTIESQAGGPIDSRMVVDASSALIDMDTWKASDGNYYHYNGMTVSVATTGEVYMLIDKAQVEDFANGWKKVGGSSDAKLEWTEDSNW